MFVSTLGVVAATAVAAGDEVVATVAAAEEDDATDDVATDSVPLGIVPNEGSVSSSLRVQPVICLEKKSVKDRKEGGNENRYKGSQSADPG
jgi:hypothetical protein